MSAMGVVPPALELVLILGAVVKLLVCFVQPITTQADKKSFFLILSISRGSC